MLERFLRDYFQLRILIHVYTLLIVFSVHILARLDQVDWYFRAVRPYSPVYTRYIMGVKDTFVLLQKTEIEKTIYYLREG